MYPASFFSSAVAILVISTSISASTIQRKRATSTVTPGTGLPSLASLNLTSADLYSMTPTVLPDGINYSQECGPPDTAADSKSDVTACFNYLVAIGNSTCGAGILCEAGTAYVSGGGTTGCLNIAVLVQEVLKRCSSTWTGGGGTDDGSGVDVRVGNTIWG